MRLLWLAAAAAALGSGCRSCAPLPPALTVQVQTVRTVTVTVPALRAIPVPRRD